MEHIQQMSHQHLKNGTVERSLAHKPQWSERDHTAFQPFIDYLEKQHQWNKQILRNQMWRIEHLDENTDLSDPEKVFTFIKNHRGKDNYKNTFLTIYKHYCEYMNIQLPNKQPKFNKNTQEIKVPTQAKILTILAECGNITAIKAKVMMEAGLRPIEVVTLKVKDFDKDQRILYPNTAKHGAPRKLKISQSLTELITAHINKWKRSQNDTIFRGTATQFGDEFRQARSRVAKKLNDESIKNVRLYDLRHYFATMDYHKFQDIKRTQYLMGHKYSQTTDVYTHLLDNGEESEFTVKTATTVQEATQLIEQGFQYVTDIENVKIFRKRK